jgi:putative component of membrane protein insertase Oxa1/YidC/SpoIIIJ protein YidD
MIRFIIFQFLLLSNNFVIAQHFHQEEVCHSFYAPQPKPVYEFAKGSTNELDATFSALFLFYKYAISSQDFNKCSFTPSCSEYGIMAVKKYGAMKGMLATIDRLNRCNGMSPENYVIDREQLKLIDNP